MKRKAISLQDAKVKVTDEDGAGWLEGYASVFGNVDLGGDVMQKGAFTKTIKERLKKGAVKLFDSHMFHAGSKGVIGVVTELMEDDYGLWFKARFASTQDAQDIRIKVKEGILDALSFGFDILQSKPDPNGKIRYITEVKLWEISVVPFGMNPKAAITGAKGTEVEVSVNFGGSDYEHEEDGLKVGDTVRMLVDYPGLPKDATTEVVLVGEGGALGLQIPGTTEVYRWVLCCEVEKLGEEAMKVLQAEKETKAADEVVSEGLKQLLEQMRFETFRMTTV